MFIKTSLIVALSFALQLPSVYAEESKPAESPKAETAKPAEAKPADAKTTETPKGDAAEVQKATDDVHRQNILMEKFQQMLQEGVKAENPALKAAAEKLAKIMDNPTPPTLDDLNAALNEYKTAKGSLSPDEGTILEDISNLLRNILKQISSHTERQEKAPAAEAMDKDEEDAEDNVKSDKK